MRLHLDEGYEILVEGGQDTYLQSHDRIPPNSVWIHRFYDPSSTTWSGEPSQFRLEDTALDLLQLIDRLKEKSGAPRVHLVAHSMGGLICRCLLQKVLPDLGRDPADSIDKLFTYGTPHGGIAFDVGFGLLEKVRDAIGINGADIFGPRRMYAYLTPERATIPDGPPESWSAHEMPEGNGSFPRERVFCLVGTDPHDYEVAQGLSAAAVGARSDGLVQIENARVPGAYTAFVHRSHSGRYGLVNSEEGYQNLRRFLFGDRKVDAALVGHRLPPAEDCVASVRAIPGLVQALDEVRADPDSVYLTVNSASGLDNSVWPGNGETVDINTGEVAHPSISIPFDFSMLLQRAFIDALEKAVTEAVPSLSGLAVDESFAATPYAGRILRAVHPDHPVLAVLDRLSAASGAAHVGLHEWRDTAADDAPHGLAYVATSGTGAVSLLAVVPGHSDAGAVAGGRADGPRLPHSLL